MGHCPLLLAFRFQLHCMFVYRQLFIIHLLNVQNLFMKLTFNCSFLLLSFWFEEENAPISRTCLNSFCSLLYLHVFPRLVLAYYSPEALHLHDAPFPTAHFLKARHTQGNLSAMQTNSAHAERGNPFITGLLLTLQLPNHPRPHVKRGLPLFSQL